MAKDDDRQDLEQMSDKDLFLEIMKLSSQDSITTRQLQMILEVVRKVTSERGDHER
jgi:hypothetical protein